MSQCSIFFPSGNAPVLDSLIINPKNGKQLMISTKKGAGAHPVLSGTGEAYNEMKRQLASSGDKKVQRELKMYEDKGYGQLATFFQTNKADALPNAQYTWAHKIAKETLAFKATKDLKKQRDLAIDVAEKLENSDYGNFCEFVFSSMNLVQVNTSVTENEDAGTMSFDNFVATWPNKLFDSVSFEAVQQGKNTNLKFGIVVGGQELVTMIEGGQDFGQADARGPSVKGQQQTRFARPEKFAGKKMPGSNARWGDFIKKLDKDYNKFLKDYPSIDGRIAQVEEQLGPAFQQAFDFQNQHGWDAERYTGMSRTVDNLMHEIYNLIHG